MIKAILSLLTAIFSLTLAVGSAYAAFTSSTISGPQTFQAGAIGLSSTNSSWEQSWYANNMSPGDTLTYTVTVSNTGNVPLKLIDASSTLVGGNLAPVINADLTPTGGWGTTIHPGGTQNVKVSINMDADAPNGYINQSGNIIATVYAESTPNE